MAVGLEPAGRCPKRMTFGPCGGVKPDGGCEIGERACPFTAVDLPVWTGSPPGGATINRRAEALRAALTRGGVVVADFPAAPLDADSLQRSAAVLRDVDAVLIGDAPTARVQFPPAYRAALLQAAEIDVWAGLNTRDRNRVALEGELAALADLGVAAVHCVTGDHPTSGERPDALAVFDLDSTQLTALAGGREFVVSVGESPAAPPVDHRPARLLSKERAGAEVCFVNHCGGVQAVSRFVRAARELGATAAMIACVPLVCDPGSAAVLASFGGAERCGDALEAGGSRAGGIAAAVQLGRQMLETGLVAGINLSGGPAAGEEQSFAEALAEVAERVRR